MQVKRLMRHLLWPQWLSRRTLPRVALSEIGAAIAASETQHRGELRFVVEGNLPFAALWPLQSPRERALDLFSSLRIWDTADNSGVLIYVQWLDRRVEIVADRGIDAALGAAFWQEVCAGMEKAFASGRFADGALTALAQITAALRTHFPPRADNANELPDAPLTL